MCMRIRIQGFISTAIQNQILSVDTIEKQLFRFLIGIYQIIMLGNNSANLNMGCCDSSLLGRHCETLLSTFCPFSWFNSGCVLFGKLTTANCKEVSTAGPPFVP